MKDHEQAVTDVIAEDVEKSAIKMSRLGTKVSRISTENSELRQQLADVSAERDIAQRHLERMIAAHDASEARNAEAERLLQNGGYIVRGSKYMICGGLAWLFGVDRFLTQSAPVTCQQCRVSTADICNQNGCGYLESGNGAPATDEQGVGS